MKIRNDFLRGTFCLFIILFITTTVNAANSLYVTSHASSNVKVFGIVGDELIFGKELSLTKHELGPVDITIDNDSETLFISSEDTNLIDLVNAKTLTFIKTIALSGFGDSGGIVYDSARNRLYCANRNYERIYSYDWDSDNKTLTPVTDSPFDLDGITYNACGLALDGDTLYVSDYYYSSSFTDTIHTYDVTDDFSYIESICMGADTVGIDYNPADGFIYGGAYGSGSNLLVKRSVDPNETITNSIPNYAIGLAADPDTAGRVYTTSYYNGGAIQMWDTASWTDGMPGTQTATFTYDSSNSDGVTVSNLAGLCVGTPYKASSTIGLKKTDDTTACVIPGDEIIYTIFVDPNGYDHEWVTVTDYLPDGISYNPVISTNPLVIDPNYSFSEHSYTWSLGPMSKTGPTVKLTLTVTVNQIAEPAYKLTNLAVVESDVAYKEYLLDTCTDCWGGNIIYVDADNTDPNNGTSWDLAYGDLQKALRRAEAGCGSEIWVAGGIYSPGNKAVDKFTVPDGVVVYGGLAGNEPNYYDPDSRTYIKYKSILTGNNKNDKIVSMGNNSKLHGFAIEDGKETNIYGSGANYTVEYCIVHYGTQRGIYCNSGNLIANWCIVKDNDYDGIYHEGSGKTLTINNSKIYGNKQNGITAWQSVPTITNCEIHHNGSDDTVYYGIRLYKPADNPYIRNNTIAYNANEGIQFEYNGYYPSVKNCILWHNNVSGGYLQMDGFSTTYDSCITDPNDPFGGSAVPDANGNISNDPDFAYDGINGYNLHLSDSSSCKNAGDDTDVETGEQDIDGDDRIDVTYVDMGADEVSCTDEIVNTLDFNGDGLVNYGEFAIFADAWLAHDPNDPGYEPDPEDYAKWEQAKRCNFDETGDSQYVVDLADLILLVDTDNWCWQACWKRLDQGFAMMAMGGGGESMLMALPMQMASFAVPAPEPTLEDKIEQAEGGLDFLNDVMEDEEAMESINQDNLQNVIDSLEDQIEEWMNLLL